jgi:electron transfer flavoprotein alpha subunit
MADILVVLEQRDGAVKRVSLEALGAARALADATGGAVHAFLNGPVGISLDGLGEAGAEAVFAALDESLALYQPDLYAAAAADHVKTRGYAAVLLPATAMGKDLGPRLAARLGCPLAADVTSVRHDGAIVVTRPVYSGKAVATVRLTAVPSVISLRPNAFRPVDAKRAGAVESVAAPSANGARARTVGIQHPEREALDVAEASVVVSGGRGLKGPENFRLIEELAGALGAAVGASRAVVDAGWRPHAEQVGQTGKTVSPNLYVAVGISGAVQHLAGMRTAKVIVAINKDKDAPIFKIADYGIVGDLFEIVPRLTQAIKQLKEQ